MQKTLPSCSRDKERVPLLDKEGGKEKIFLQIFYLRKVLWERRSRRQNCKKGLTIRWEDQLLRGRVLGAIFLKTLPIKYVKGTIITLITVKKAPTFKMSYPVMNINNGSIYRVIRNGLTMVWYSIYLLAAGGISNQRISASPFLWKLKNQRVKNESNWIYAEG